MGVPIFREDPTAKEMVTTAHVCVDKLNILSKRDANCLEIALRICSEISSSFDQTPEGTKV